MKHCASSDCQHLRRYGSIAEFLDSIDICSDCGSELVPGPAPQASWTEPRELATIYSTDSGVNAHILKSVLEAQGIPVVIVGEPLGAAIGELPIPFGQILVQVPPEHSTRARELAMEWDDGALEAGDTSS